MLRLGPLGPRGVWRQAAFLAGRTSLIHGASRRRTHTSTSVLLVCPVSTPHTRARRIGDAPPSPPAAEPRVRLTLGDGDPLLAYVRILLEWDARRPMIAPTTGGDAPDHPDDRGAVRPRL